MSRRVQIFLVALVIAIVVWFWSHADFISGLDHGREWLVLLGVIMLYMGSHVLRMLRLIMLTIDERNKAFPLVAAHGLTAFPGSLLPFKIGELLRLAAFFHVYDGRRKALAVWLVERFADVSVITVFILGLYLFDIAVPGSMRTIFIVFAVISILALLCVFSVSKVLGFLNKQLVLKSNSQRGLVLLRIVHAIECLEADIYRSAEGRLPGILLFSVFIWGLEIASLLLFVNQAAVNLDEFVSLFISGRPTSLLGTELDKVSAYGLYQSSGLALLALFFIVAVGLSAYLRNSKV